MLTNERDWILDPFNGAGTTTKAASDLERNSVGFDLEQKYINYARLRLNDLTTVRAKQLRVLPVDAHDFVPGRSKGKTRHGAGLKTKRKNPS
jgi:DNA modification methylase